MTEPRKKKYDSTVARIAGNLLSGQLQLHDQAYRDDYLRDVAEQAVRLARAIVDATLRSEPPDAS